MADDGGRYGGILEASDLAGKHVNYVYDLEESDSADDKCSYCGLNVHSMSIGHVDYPSHQFTACLLACNFQLPTPRQQCCCQSGSINGHSIAVEAQSSSTCVPAQ